MGKAGSGFALPQTGGAIAIVRDSMATTVFRCPNLLVHVQGWFSDDAVENGDDAYESVLCTACQNIHLVDPKTGKVLGPENE